MKREVVLVLVLSFLAAVRGDTNVCFDPKYMDELTAYQRECAEMLDIKGNETKILFCVFKKVGITKENEDVFDFQKTKEHFLSRIENEELKKKVEQGLLACELKDPKGGMDYYDCFAIKTIGSICFKSK